VPVFAGLAAGRVAGGAENDRSRKGGAAELLSTAPNGIAPGSAVKSTPYRPLTLPLLPRLAIADFYQALDLLVPF
jgi:hypothetical protein